MTGDRGMETLLKCVNRNYLPSNLSALQSAAQGAGSFAGLAAGVRTAAAARRPYSRARSLRS